MKNPRTISLLVSGFFIGLFLVATIIYAFIGGYLQMLGFLLLAVSNVLPFRAVWQEQELTAHLRLVTNILAFGGLGLVAIGALSGMI